MVPLHTEARLRQPLAGSGSASGLSAIQPCSPDLNPIEPLWFILKSRIYKIPGSPKSPESCWSAAQQVWESLTVEEIQAAIGSMPERVEAVRKADGLQTRYLQLPYRRICATRHTSMER